ncbi:MAG: ATP-binding cassette domain-containing protein, partial [Vulcanibacillus sp.]
MLELKNIKKSYKIGEQIFPALNGIDLVFKKNEFVSILGASGSGKTTLLNIIGG